MRYAIIQDNVVVNLVEAEPEFAASQGWVEAPEYVNDEAVSILWFYDGTNFMPPQQTQPE